MNSELEQLNRRIEALEATLKSMAEHTAAIAKRLERWERDGVPFDQPKAYAVA